MSAPRIPVSRGQRTPSPHGARRRPIESNRPSTHLLALAVCALLSVSACGSADDQETAAGPSQRTTVEGREMAPPPSSERSDGAGGGSGFGGRRQTESWASRHDSTGPSTADRRTGRADDGRSDCRYVAPPGRLALRNVLVSVGGLSCAEGKRLALAAAMGQPAGANLVIRTKGFRCLPSTTRKGANVAYTCKRDKKQARFRIVWSR